VYSESLSEDKKIEAYFFLRKNIEKGVEIIMSSFKKKILIKCFKRSKLT